MISKELFVKMMRLAEMFDAELDRWSEFGIEFYEMAVGDIPWGMFNGWLESHFDVEGKDWVNWYLWERKSFSTNEVLPCYHEDGTKFYVNTPEDLGEIMLHGNGTETKTYLESLGITVESIHGHERLKVIR